MTHLTTKTNDLPPSPPLKACISVLKEDLPLRIIQVVNIWVLILIIPPGHGALQSLSPLLILSEQISLMQSTNVVYSRVELCISLIIFLLAGLVIVK